MRATHDGGPLRIVDVFAGCYTVLLMGLYLGSLPLHAMINTRYLFPAYPLLAYAVVRLPAVRRVINRRWHLSVWTYLGTVGIGGQLLLAGTTLFTTGVGEAMQAHAVVSLLVAGVVTIWAVVATLLSR